MPYLFLDFAIICGTPKRTSGADLVRAITLGGNFFGKIPKLTTMHTKINKNIKQTTHLSPEVKVHDFPYKLRVPNMAHIELMIFVAFVF